MLKETNDANFTLPFRSNHAVATRSTLYHESGQMLWAPGYTKRRLNLTFLFGKMYGKCKKSNPVSDRQHYRMNCNFVRALKWRLDRIEAGSPKQGEYDVARQRNVQKGKMKQTRNVNVILSL
jgi:hypothetical protein